MNHDHANDAQTPGGRLRSVSAASFPGAELRPMEEYQAEAVASLVARTMNADEGEQARKTIAFHHACLRHGIDDGRAYYVLSAGPSVVGVAGLHHYVWGPGENVWLAWFAVAPEAQAKGIGRRLLEAVTDEARSLGYRKLFVETYSTPEFARARACYEALGFERAGIVARYLPEGGDMVVFVRELFHAV